RAGFVANSARQALQERVEALLHDPDEPDVSSWFVTDSTGLQLARAPAEDTLGKSFAWRSYFTGQNEDLPETQHPNPDEHIKSTNLSAVYYSQVNDRWTVTISTPIFVEDEAAAQKDEEHRGTFLGVVGVSVDVHKFLEIPESAPKLFAVLV